MGVSSQSSSSGTPLLNLNPLPVRPSSNFNRARASLFDCDRCCAHVLMCLRGCCATDSEGHNLPNASDHTSDRLSLEDEMLPFSLYQFCRFP